MPRFPDTARMSRQERFVAISVYLGKVVDHLQGVDDEHIPSIMARSNSHRPRSQPVSESIEIKDLLSNLQEANTSSEIG